MDVARPRPYVADVRERGGREENVDLPVNGEAVDEDWMALLCGGLTETFEEDQDAWSLLIVQARIVAHDDIVQQNVDVRHFMGVERRDQGVRIGDQIALGSYQLQDEADLDNFRLVEGLARD